MTRAGDPRHALGAEGEAVAERWLRGAGLVVVARRFRTRGGEIDLIVRDGGVLVFVEVKLRSREDFGRPAEAVTAVKQRRLARAAALYLTTSGGSDGPCRFDVVEVRPAPGAWAVTHIPDAFRPRD
ncbi:MAG TPA: YraN family protein [Candidatus Polarisedimenticolaceae bacterium]|nr:YraN family protein [Candidatus Polarisedimenticolaceae bacterium]